MTRSARLVNAFAVSAMVVLLVSAIVVSRWNVRAGRGDWKGAIRLGGVAVAAQLLTWALNDPHGGDPNRELNRFFSSLGEALFAGGLLVVMHLAVEPSVRRYWPDGLLGWTRLLQGRFLDARVGRDVLVGLGAGAILGLIIASRDPIQWALGVEYPAASFGHTRYFEGMRYVLGFLSSMIGFQATFSAMWFIFGIVGLKRLLRRMWLVAVVATPLFAFVTARDIFIDAPGIVAVNVAVAFAIVGLIAALAVRMGLLATAAALFANYVVSATPWTFDTGAWYFPPAALAFVALTVLALFAGHAARTPSSLPQRT